MLGFNRSTAKIVSLPTPKTAVVDLFRGLSIETAPGIAAKTASYGAHLAPETPVYITMLPGADLGEIVQTAARLRGEGLVPVPHIAARSLESHAQLDDYLRRLAGEAAVDQVLVIGGGVSTPAGPFDRSMQVLETGLLQKHGITTIGVAGHPEGSKDIPADEIARAVAEKNAYARTTGTAMYIATQFCFDAEAIIAWDRSLRRAGNVLPIHLGLAGPAKLKSLIHYAAMCGVGPSIRFLTRQAMNIAKLASVSVPDKLLVELADYRAKEQGCGLAQLHLFAFGGLERSARWVKAMQDGRFTFDGRGGFAMDESLD
ncbi:MAG TPA: metFprotein [Inquilinus sp.]|nr:metFprotein [Inquilinus sp.]